MADKRMVQDRIAEELLRIRKQIAEIKSAQPNPAEPNLVEATEIKEPAPKQDRSSSLEEQLRGRIMELEWADEGLRGQINELRQSEEELKKKTELQEEQLRERIMELERANEDLRGQISELRQSAEELRGKMELAVEQLGERVAQLEQANGEIHREIGDQRQTEEELRNKQAMDLAAKPETVNEHVEDAVVEINPDGIILNWNSRAETVYGYSSQHVKGFPFFILVPRERYDEFQRIIDLAKQGQEVPPTEAYLVKKDGEQIKVSVSISAFRDSAGQVTGISVTTRDISKLTPKLKEKKSKSKK